MNERPHDHDWEERLRAAIGTASAPDFDAWRKRYPDAVASLTPAIPVQRLSLREKLSRRAVVASLKWMTASLLIIVGLLWMTLSSANLGPSAFAEDIPGIDGVRTMTWTTTHYIRWISKDGKRTWVTTEQRLHAYRYPGQYRETRLDENGQPASVVVTDYRAQRALYVNLKEKTATLKFPDQQRDDRSPFAWVGDVIRERKLGQYYRVKSVSLQGEREIDNTHANVVRVKIRNVEDGVEFRPEFLFDVVSKQLVGIWEPNPGVDYDPDTANDRSNPPEQTWSKMVPFGAFEHEMVLNPRLDPSDFSLDPPTGYAFEKLAKPTVTEEEMIAYLGAAARFNNNQFPDSPYNAFDRVEFNAASDKASKDRTEAEQTLIAIRDKIMMRGIYRSPVKQFEEDQTESNSFHYVGAGVKVGQADRLVAWYRYRNGTKYRALYGDLSVKDVTEAELPLKLSE